MRVIGSFAPRSHDSSCFLVDASLLTHPDAPDSVQYPVRLTRKRHGRAASDEEWACPFFIAKKKPLSLQRP
jgi:hypothetical protein